MFNSHHITSNRLRVPVLIAARNEELLIENALDSIIRSVIFFREAHTGCDGNNSDDRFDIIICDNGSTDDTIMTIQNFIKKRIGILEKNRIHIHILSEVQAGKVFALRKMINYIENSPDIPFDHVIFTDADIEWSTNVYTKLILYKTANPQKYLIGTRLEPKNKTVNFWGKLELLPYYGYGELTPDGYGKFFSFISGMGYLADRQILGFLKNEIPPVIGNEDVAFSIMAGKDKIHILNNASIYYYVSNNINQFVRVRGRHIREMYRLFRYIKKWYLSGNEKIVDTPNHQNYQRHKNRNIIHHRFYSISEIRMIPYILGFYQSSQKFCLFKHLRQYYQWLKTIPAFKLGINFIFFYHPVALVIYFFLKIICYFQSFFHHQTGWESVRTNLMNPYLNINQKGSISVFEEMILKGIEPD